MLLQDEASRKAELTQKRKSVFKSYQHNMRRNRQKSGSFPKHWNGKSQKKRKKAYDD
ncbi:hypothetical protein [[Clostridium] scindens]|nr:hypothetical protein [[Clostridium] scindens]MCI6396184.1 hypothetical protein [[Clostridium] scindens]MDY4867896.1 hypothetical protein [[Clostridium] scindens]MEE0649329.1 hypothetical protein [[Clostridium] scindens]